MNLREEEILKLTSEVLPAAEYDEIPREARACFSSCVRLAKEEEAKDELRRRTTTSISLPASILTAASRSCKLALTKRWPAIRRTKLCGHLPRRQSRDVGRPGDRGGQRSVVVAWII